MSDPLRILLVAPGGSLHTRRWVAALEAAGHRVTVVSWRASLVPWLRLRRLVQEVRPDVVHVHSVGTQGVLALGLPAGVPRVVTPWGSELRAARRSAVRRAVIRRVAGRADLVLLTSTEVAAEMVSRYAVPAARTRVLSWGVAAELISAATPVSASVLAAYGIPADATVVLSIRSATATYRVREVVAAFGRAVQDRPDLFLVVLSGHLPSAAGARRAASGYLDGVRGSCDRMVVVDGTLSPLQVFGLMSAADVAVSVPAADQRSSSVLEAALAGCRLLLSDIAPYRELARDGLAAELLAEPVTESLADALARPAPSGRAANRAFILAREHGAEKAAALEQIYRDLVQGGRACRG